jgi:PEGA domain-containing protein
MNPDAPPPRSPVLLLGDDWDERPKRPRVVMIAAVVVVVVIVTGFGLLRSRERTAEADNARDWKPISLLPAALSRDPEFHGAPVQIDPPVDSPSPEGRGGQGVRTPRAAPAPAASAPKARGPVVRPPPVSRGRPQVRPGYISINSRPWAELSVDGRVVGNTPQIKIWLTPGRHQVLLTREGFQTYTAWVVVPPDGNVRLTDITLTATP